jgi:hypothetical protein
VNNDDEDEDRPSLHDMLGELDTLFSDRGWSDCCGKELDRRSCVRDDFAAACTSLLDEFRGPDVVALTASVRVFKDLLMTSVARINFSFAVRHGVSSCTSTFCVFVRPVLVLEVVLAVFFVIVETVLLEFFACFVVI